MQMNPFVQLHAHASTKNESLIQSYIFRGLCRRIQNRAEATRIVKPQITARKITYPSGDRWVSTIVIELIEAHAQVGRSLPCSSDI